MKKGLNGGDLVPAASILLAMSPVAQIAKGFGPQWHDALLGVPFTLSAIGFGILWIAFVAWLWKTP